MLAFSSHYLEVRRREGRLLTREQIVELSHRRLPQGISTDQRQEWPLRWHSMRVLLRRLATLQARSVLDAGSGCGWTSALLRSLGHSTVSVDPVLPELLVGRQLGLPSAAGRIEQLPLAPQRFDAAIAASCLQYLPDLAAAVDSLRATVRPGGSVFVCDTPFYSDDEVDSARRRSRSHYRSLGVPNAADFYHHHTRSALESLEPSVLYDPRRLQNRLARRLGIARSPFPVLEFAK